MRNNQPVNNTESVLRDTQCPISRTDLHGNITFANADFVEAIVSIATQAAASSRVLAEQGHDLERSASVFRLNV
jgi:hypothetical protein